MSERNKQYRAAIYTLGCKVNQYESEAISEALQQQGFQIVPFDEAAEVYIINTCTVTAESDRKACQMIRRAAAMEKTVGFAPAVIVTGCMAQTQPERAAAISGVRYVCGSRNKLSCVDAAVRFVKQIHAEEALAVTPEVAVSAPDASGMEEMTLQHTGLERTRAYIKIEDGCENRCTYCAIPGARGNVVSKRPETVLCELHRLFENGYREFVLTGIEIASYGIDFDAASGLQGYRLVDLLEAAEASFANAPIRIRLGSLEPTYMKPETVRRMAALPHLTHHFHLSLQSGADHVLHLMRRKYNMRMVREILADIRAAMPDVMFTTDIMTGFPQETEEDFAQTMAFAKEARLLHIHVFPYSRRKNTVADTMPGQLPNEEKNRRANALIALQREIEEDIYREIAGSMAMSGGEVPFLAETFRDGVITGHTDNFLEVQVRSDAPITKELCRVAVTGADGLHLTGTLME